MTEVWFRNPWNYIRELAEVRVPMIVWDRGMCVKRRIDPIKHAEVYFAGQPWRVLLVGEQGTAEYGHLTGTTPIGVYPTWDASEEDLSLLEEMMQYPISEDADACNDPNLAEDERPRSSQDHRVVVINIPELNTGPGRAFIRKLKELQEDYPECILHVHGLYSWRASFGMGFLSTDIDPRTNAGKGKVTLPNGKEVIAEKTAATPQWVTLLGMKPIDLTREPRNRCIYNIKSAVWAGEHYAENFTFLTVKPKNHKPDITSPNPPAPTTVHNTPFTRPIVPQPTDKLNCNTCSLQNSCKYFREGSVCSVPGSEPAELAKLFGSRDADHIIDGLGTLLSMQARRLDRGVAEENEWGELNPEVTKIANQLFTNGSKLAKLIDPSRFAGPKVQVNVSGGATAAIQAATPNQIMGSIVRELESRGIPREQITPDMVANLLQEMGGAGQAPAAIQGAVLGSRDE